MKSMIKNRLLLVTAICFLFATSCQYDEIVDIPYPESLVYLPIAVNGSISPDGIYTIEEGASTAWVSPTPGQPMKYTVRNADNAFVIPLGIYRSGTGKTIKGSVNVSVMLNTDTVQTLIDNGVLTDVEVLPSEYVLQIPQNIQIPDGKNETTFDVSVALDFLRKDAPKKYAMGIVISDENNRVNKQLNTGIILIDTKITIPVATFTTHNSTVAHSIRSYLLILLFIGISFRASLSLGILEMGPAISGMKLIRNINMELLAIIM